MKPVKVRVDTREKEHVRKYLTLEGIPFTTATMTVGDYRAEGDHGIVVMERKSIGDLIGSHVSKRLDVQLTNLSKEKCPILLVTGTYEDVKRYAPKGITEEDIHGIIASAVVRYGMRSVIWIQGVKDKPHADGLTTAVKVIKKIAEGKLDSIPDRTIAKKDHPQRELIKHILGVPSNVAMNLLTKFGTIRAIINAPNSELLKVEGVGIMRVKRIRSMLDTIHTSDGVISAFCDKCQRPMVVTKTGQKWKASCIKCNATKEVQNINWPKKK